VADSIVAAALFLLPKANPRRLVNLSSTIATHCISVVHATVGIPAAGMIDGAL
jgi:hypothetical protein